jgi:Kef-type K+ transport system membrane component KefB
MFVIGMELDIKVLKKQSQWSIVISHASIVIPFALGIGLSYFVFNQFASEGVQFFFQFVYGIAMSITAWF